MSAGSSTDTFPFTASAPGRICLFGEHQDYLGLPVIAAALALRIRISGQPIAERAARLSMPDIGSQDVIPLTEDLSYRHNRDYLRSAVNILRREGFTFSRGIEAEIHGEIPINSGTSSSSALVVAWVTLLARISDQSISLDPHRAAGLAHRAEVIEFSEPGGTMDHFSSAFGGVIYLMTREHRVEKLHPQLGSFVLADSGEQKDTTGILLRVKEGVQSIAEKLISEDPEATISSLDPQDVSRFGSVLTDDERSILDATLVNRDITLQGHHLLKQERVDHRALGKLLHKHQSYLREPLRISTPKIDAMIQAAYDAGALGAKINGSGGGGCMFAYAPEDPEAVRDALKPFGRSWIVDIDDGVRLEVSGGTV